MTGNNDFGQGRSVSGDMLQLVSFEVAGEQYAVDILRVQEINRMMSLTTVPQSPPGIEGVINLRGRIIPVLDLRIRFGLAPTETTERSRIVVVETNSAVVGFIVDGVHEVLRIDPTVVDETPPLSSGVDATYLQGVAKLEDRLIVLLDLDALFSNGDAAEFARISQPAQTGLSNAAA